MPHLIKYRQFYPNKQDFQFWRDRMVCLEVFGMRWCVVVYGPVFFEYKPTLGQPLWCWIAPCAA